MTEAYNQECFTCARISFCSEVDTQKLLSGHVCPLFAAVEVPVVQARSAMMQQYDLVAAARALLKRSPDSKQEEHVEMSLELPAPGTSYTERKKQLEVMTFMDVRILGAKKYKDQAGQPVLDWDETLRVDRKNESIEKVLAFELANNLIVPDAAAQQVTQAQGAPQMTQPFTPGNGVPPPPGAPVSAPPQMPMPGAPPMQGGFAPPPAPGFPAAPPMVPGMPGMAPPGFPPGMPPPPYGAAPVPAGVPQQAAPPGAPPPVATPQQAAAAGPGAPMEAAPTGERKKKKGAAAAPPPPPPPGYPPPGAGAPTGYANPPPPAAAPQAAPSPYAAPGMPAPAGWPPPGAPAPMAAPQQAMMAPPQQPPQQQPVPQAGAPVDLSPVLQLVDQVGKGVNAMGGAQGEQLKRIETTLAELKNLLLVQVTALHHIYLSTPGLAQSVQGKDVGDANKFLAYMQPFLPR